MNIKPMSWERFFRPPARGSDKAEKQYSTYCLSIEQYNAVKRCDEFTATDKGRMMAKKMIADGKIIQAAVNKVRSYS